MKYYWYLGVAILVFFIRSMSPAVHAVDCSFSQTGNVYTLQQNCQFGETVDGLDAGEGASNSAKLVVPTGTTLTVIDRSSSPQTLIVGSLQVEEGGTIINPEGSQIVIGQPICLTDSDTDGYIDNGTQSFVPFKASVPGTCVRKSIMHTRITEEGRQTIDCNSANASYTTECSSTTDLTQGSLNRITSVSTPSALLQDYYQEIGKDNGLVGLWHMNEIANDTCSDGKDACDSSGNGFNGTATGTTIADGKIKKGRNFNGSSYITVADNDKLSFVNRIMSVAGWIRTSSATVQMIMEKGAASNYEYTLRTNADGTLIFILYLADGSAGDSATSTTNIADGQWHHVAGVADNVFVYLYIDGKLEAKTALTRTLTNGTAPLYIGARTGSNYYFIGDMDEVAIWNRSLAPEEIALFASRRPWGSYTSSVIDAGAEISNTTLTWVGAGVGTRTYSTGTLTSDGGETPYSSVGLVAQWNFNETSGTTATNTAGADSCGGTPANCNGTLKNFTYTAFQDQAGGTGWTNYNKRWGQGALMFEGTNDYVSLPNTLDTPLKTGSFTVSAWVNARNFTNPVAFLSRGLVTASSNNYGMEMVLGSGGFTFMRWVGSTSNNYISYVFTPSLGTWYFLVATYDKTTGDANIYVNGKKVGTGTFSTSNVAYNATYDLGYVVGGRIRNVSDLYSNEIIDSLSIYSRVLSPEEVLSNYNAGAIEMQWRAGSTTTPDSTDYAAGTNWTQWAPVGIAGYETQLDAMDSTQASWFWDINSAGNADGTTATSMPKVKAQDTTHKQEGTGSLKLAVGQPQVDANTAALWHMEETSGTGAYIKDSSANANNGTPTGTAVADGFFGKGRAITTGERISIPHSTSLNLTNNFTISAWAKFASAGVNNMIASKYAAQPTGWAFFRNSDNKFYMQGGNGTSWLGAFNCATSATWTDTAWHHVATTVGPSNVIIYVDGVAQATCALSAAAATNTTDVVLGGYNTTSVYSGLLDEVHISNVVRSADQIAEEYRAGRDHRLTRVISSTDATSKTKLPFWIASDRLGTFAEMTVGDSAFANYEPDSNTAGLWHIEEKSGSGAYIKDSSANANNGTPAGVELVQGKIGKGLLFNKSTGEQLDMGSGASLDLGDTFTISAWINPTTLANYSNIVNKVVSPRATTYSYMLVLHGDGTLGTYSPASNWGFSIATGITTGKWYHVAWVLTGGRIYSYVNGQNLGSRVFSYTDTAAHNVFVGTSHNSGVTYNFNGLIDEVRMDSVARTAAEIRQAYEVGLRTHPITIDFKAALSETVGSSTTSFGIDETAYGSSQKANHIFRGDTIILRENIDGTEYMVQGRVDTVNAATGALTVTWESGQTWPTNFTTNATVFKWQREWMDLTGIPVGTGAGDVINAKDALTRLTLRLTDTSQGANIWLDDMRVGGPYINTSPQSVTISPAKQYLQLRALFSTADIATSSGLSTFYTGTINPTLTPTPTPIP